MSEKTNQVVVLGTGYWGKNLVRNFNDLTALHGICDNDPNQLEEIKNKFQVEKAYTNFEEVFNAQDVQGVVIATPAATHYELTKKALLAGKDVFVEKPISLKVREAEELIDIAKTKKRILMVDHLLQYHGAVNKLKQIIAEGKLGKIQYIYSNRLNIGKLRSEENILWSFAPHDISVILALVEKLPTKVEVFGGDYLQDEIYDTTVTNLTFSQHLKAHIFVSWLHPFKEQKLVVVGNQGMAVFNDVEPEEKLSFYPHKIDWVNQVPIANKAEREVIPFEKTEPLKEACNHFLECMQTRKKPKTDGEEALAVLKVLEQAQTALDKG